MSEIPSPSLTKSILLVEDDSSLGKSLMDLLGKDNYRVRWLTTYEQASQALENNFFDVAIVDLGLPDGSGLKLAEKMKAAGEMPVIIMTAQNSAENRLQAYELGSEEFIPKPFHFRELQLRLQHVLQSHSPLEKIELPGGTLELDKMCFRRKDGTMTFFSPKDFRVLKMLVQCSPRPVHRDEVLDQIWGQDQFPTQRTVDNAIVRIRQSLGDESGEQIKSVRGIGYQWMGPDSNASASLALKEDKS